MRTSKLVINFGLFLIFVIAVYMIAVMIVQRPCRVQERYIEVETPNSKTTEFPEMKYRYSKISTLIHPSVKVVPSVPNRNLDNLDCVPLPSSPKPGVVICLHPVKDDQYVSGNLKKGNLWEHNLIIDMHKVLTDNPTFQLVDIGSNIGEYTLWAAAMGRDVLAVEMMMFNIELMQTSLKRSNLAPMVTIVNNAMYRDHRQIGTAVVEKNIGASYIVGSTSGFDNKNDTTKNTSNPLHTANVTVNTICMNDLLPLLKRKSIYLKMDIERSEHHVLACADEFFNTVDIPYVQMEWLDRPQEERSLILDFMSKYNFVAATNILDYQHFLVDLRNVPTTETHDVFFIRRKTISRK